MAECILQQKARLMKQPKPPTEEIANDEVFLSKVLTPLTYAQADLTQIVCNCMDLDIDQQPCLLQILHNHETLFLGKHGHLKGGPMEVEVMEGATPVWSKPYPGPLKNCKVFKDEFYRQCQIGALWELTAEVRIGLLMFRSPQEKKTPSAWSSTFANSTEF
jgi:hypothetical protein